MKLNTLLSIIGFTFSFIAVVHLVRVFMAWELQVNSFVVPFALSWVAFAVAGFLAYEAFTIKQK
jgi:hypothetical protein